MPLGARQARNIGAPRPIESLEALDSVSYMGASALGKLRDYAAGTVAAAAPADPAADPGPAPTGGADVTVEGIVFTGDEAAAALARPDAAQQIVEACAAIAEGEAA